MSESLGKILTTFSFQMTFSQKYIFSDALLFSSQVLFLQNIYLGSAVLSLIIPMVHNFKLLDSYLVFLG